MDTLYVVAVGLLLAIVAYQAGKADGMVQRNEELARKAIRQAKRPEGAGSRMIH